MQVTRAAAVDAADIVAIRCDPWPGDVAGSDADIDNADGPGWHAARGSAEIGRAVNFARPIADEAHAGPAPRTAAGASEDTP